jgi:hypothetical protein
MKIPHRHNCLKRKHGSYIAKQRRKPPKASNNRPVFPEKNTLKSFFMKFVGDKVFRGELDGPCSIHG